MVLKLARKKLEEFLEEDAWVGDITSQVLDISGKQEAVIYAKSEGVLAGTTFVKEIFKMLDPESYVIERLREGEEFSRGEELLVVVSEVKALLTGERLSLNLLQRLSGIAHFTRRFVKILEGTKIQLLDTRKTTPGFRLFEKYAVRVGGGRNHRIGLFDGIIIKDNHIKAAGGIRKAVEMARMKANPLLKIEVETTNLEEVEEAVESGADMIMLDNMSKDQMVKAIEIIRKYDKNIKIEASGNINEEKLKEIRDLDLDFVSSGAIIHSSPWCDLSKELRVVPAAPEF